MQKKNDNFLEKIVKKDYNNELEAILEKKYFNEDVKSILLNILYKIETAYKDYKKVKQDTETKDEYIEKIIDIIKNECEEIKLVKPYSEESKIIGNKTFLVEKNKKRIICYNVERKLLYCISKISKQEEIVKNNYFLVNKTLSNLINTGNNINTVEPLRDFNGYSAFGARRVCSRAARHDSAFAFHSEGKVPEGRMRCRFRLRNRLQTKK